MGKMGLYVLAVIVSAPIAILLLDVVAVALWFVWEAMMCARIQHWMASANEFPLRYEASEHNAGIERAAQYLDDRAIGCPEHEMHTTYKLHLRPIQDLKRLDAK